MTNGGFDEKNEQSVVTQRASELVDEIRAGKTLGEAKRENPTAVMARAREILLAHGWDRKTSAALRRARTDMLVASDDPDIAARGIELSQKEDGVGSGPGVAVQVNAYRDAPPASLGHLFDGTTEESSDAND